MIQDYTYLLPEERVAQYPLEDRDASKLLVYEEGRITETLYKDMAGLIPSGALMVFNDTRVIEARLLFQKETGARIEIFCLEPLDMEPSRAMNQEGKATWKCLVGGAGKWKAGRLHKELPLHSSGEDPVIHLYAEKGGEVPDGYRIHFSWTPEDMPFVSVLHHAGLIPLPPYMHRSAGAGDVERYQTVYARFDGSVAAPTAGLHFTPSLLERLNRAEVQTGFVTLHVGAGTFKPVKAERMSGHVMHAEWIDVTDTFIEQLLDAEGPVIAVGTTALRTLESLYWMGVKALQGPVTGEKEISLGQWEIYEHLPQDTDWREALKGLLNWMKQRGMDRLVTQTQLLIAPGYRVRMVDGIITNFHQPGSTLLLLVAALVGEDWKSIYQYALEHHFRFLSYGDGSLLWFRR